MTLQITEQTVNPEELPQDDPPMTDSTESTGWFNPDYPHSTEEHPYGYFPDGKGGWDFNKPRKRRPHNRSRNTVNVASSARADATAKTAAAMLARMNGLVGMALMSFGMPLSGKAISDANTVFEGMAYEALQTDPNLARKILAAGATSGKAQLTMAYIMLAGSVAPIAASEIKANRLAKQEEEIYNGD